MNLNKVMLIGNMTKDPEIRVIQSGQSVATFAVATNRSWKNKEGEQQKEVQFTDIVAWEPLANIVKQYTHKGSKIYIEGRLQTRSWTTDDGQKKYKTEVVAQSLILLDSAPPRDPLDQTKGQEMSGQENQDTRPLVNNEEVDIEDIPF